jgi:hypothetical protein
MNCGGTDTIVAKQTLSTADLAPLTDDAAAPLQFSFNTAAFNPTTGAVAFKNGACTLKAKAITSTGTQVASTTENITLNNADTVAATVTTTPVGSQKASATDAAGLLWKAGTVTVTAVPVIYSAGASAASAAISLVNLASASDTSILRGASSAPGALLATMSNLTPTSGVFTATFPKDMSSSGVDSTSIKAVGVLVTTVTSAGNPGPTDTASTANVIRLDNLPPPKAKFKIDSTKFGGVNGWLGKNFVFSTASKTVVLGSNTAVADSAAWDNGGVDVVTFTTQFKANGASSSTYATFSSVTGLAETSASGGTGSYDIRLVLCDALNNCTNTASSGFGVDLTAPSLAELTGPKDHQIFNIDSVIPTTASFQVTDSSATAGVTASGPTLGAEVLVAIQGLRPKDASSSQTVCFTGVSTGSSPSVTCKAPVTENQASVPLPSAATVFTGEWTMTVNALDQAGNQSAPLTIAWYNDQDVPVVSGGVTIPNPITTGTSFSLSATDSMDVNAGAGSLQYPGFAFFEPGTSSSAGVAFDNVLTRSGTISVALSTFFKGLTPTINTTGSVPTGLNVRAVDAANNVSANTTVAFPAANLGTPGTISNSGSNGITNAAAFAVPAADTAGQTVALSDSLTAVSPTSGSPFGAGGQVCFYYAAPTGTPGGTGGPAGVVAGELVKIGCTASPVTVGTAPRLIAYAISWTIPAAFKGQTLPIYAVGITSGNDALITSAGSITVAP